LCAAPKRKKDAFWMSTCLPRYTKSVHVNARWPLTWLVWRTKTSPRRFLALIPALKIAVGKVAPKLAFILRVHDCQYELLLLPLRAALRENRGLTVLFLAILSPLSCKLRSYRLFWATRRTGCHTRKNPFQKVPIIYAHQNVTGNRLHRWKHHSLGSR
jgi:hypothetical protein